MGDPSEFQQEPGRRQELVRGAQERQHSVPEQKARTRGQKAGTAGSQWACARTPVLQLSPGQPAFVGQVVTCLTVSIIVRLNLGIGVLSVLSEADFITRPKWFR